MYVAVSLLYFLFFLCLLFLFYCSFQKKPAQQNTNLQIKIKKFNQIIARTNKYKNIVYRSIQLLNFFVLIYFSWSKHILLFLIFLLPRIQHKILFILIFANMCIRQNFCIN